MDDYVSLPVSVAQQSGASGATFEAWVYPTAAGTGRHQVISTDDGGYDWSLLHENGTWHVFTGTSSIDTGLTVDVGRWQHVAAVFDPAQGVRFYKDVREFSTAEIGYDASAVPAAVGHNPG